MNILKLFAGSDQANQLLFKAAQNGDVKAAKWALYFGADINATKPFGPYSEEIFVESEWYAPKGLQATAAYVAAQCNHTDVFDFLAQQKNFNPFFLAFVDRHQRDWNEFQHTYTDAYYDPKKGTIQDYPEERKVFDIKDAVELLKETHTVETKTIDHIKRYIETHKINNTALKKKTRLKAQEDFRNKKTGRD